MILDWFIFKNDGSQILDYLNPCSLHDALYQVATRSKHKICICFLATHFSHMRKCVSHTSVWWSDVHVNKIMSCTHQHFTELDNRVLCKVLVLLFNIIFQFVCLFYFALFLFLDNSLSFFNLIYKDSILISFIIKYYIFL